MLVPVRLARPFTTLLTIIAVLFLAHIGVTGMSFHPAGEQTAQLSSKGTTPRPQGPVPPPAQVPAPQPAPVGARVVVLDPAHGGADAGARGEGGVNESEVVLTLAQQVRAELERRGLRVVQTRQVNENPSFDERSAVANGQRGAIFISIHVSSTGPVGTARAYSVAAGPLGRQAGTAPEAKPATAPHFEKGTLVRWDQAQESFAPWSRRLAELVQVQLAMRFRGSPDVPGTAPVRQLRTVAAPAVAIEISSVSVVNRKQIEQMGPALADAIARAVEAFPPPAELGAQ